MDFSFMEFVPVGWTDYPFWNTELFIFMDVEEGFLRAKDRRSVTLPSFLQENQSEKFCKI